MSILRDVLEPESEQNQEDDEDEDMQDQIIEMQNLQEKLVIILTEY